MAWDETALRIRRHYQSIGLWDGWPAERFMRLCQLMQCTQHQLAALCCITPQQLSSWCKRDHFPPYVALHFHILESTYMQLRGLAAQPPMPAWLLGNNDTRHTHD